MNELIGVIGGGPAGIMAAGTAGSCGKSVILIEKNERLGKKLFITDAILLILLQWIFFLTI